jgi:sulfate permease, SulP family
MLGVMIFGTLPGLFIGIGVSLVLLIYRASRPYVAVLGRTPDPERAYRDVDRHHDAQPLHDIVVLRIESGLYFANADNVRARIVAAAGAEGVRAVIIDAETTPFVDVSAARMLVAAHDELRGDGVRLVFARDVGQVRDVLGVVAEDGDVPASYPTIDAAIDALGGAHPIRSSA